MVKLGEVCTIVSGTTPKSTQPEYWDGDLNWVTPAELTEESNVIYESQRKITQQAVIDSSLKSFPAGTVLLSSRAPIGKVAIAGTEMYCNQGFKNLICSEKIYNRYLYHYLKSKAEYLNSLGRGATFKEISKAIVENIEIHLPPLAEQRKIAAVLDKVSDLIAKRRQQLTKLDELVKARFVEIFGDPENNEKNWKMRTFKEICTVRQGLQIPISKRLTHFEENCYEYITVAYLHGIKDKEYIKNPKSTVICTKEDILMTRTGNTGMIITNVAGVFHNNFFLIDFDREKYIREFLVEYLNLDFMQTELKKRAGTSTIPDLNHGEFYKIAIYEPPINLQNQFATFVNQTKQSKTTISRSLEKLETLKRALMQEYFG